MRKNLAWIGLVSLVIAVVYAPVVRELVADWIRDPNYSHGFLIPAISGFVLWQRREELRLTPLRGSYWGLLGIVGAMALYTVGRAGAEVFTQRVSLIGLLGSTVVLLGGWQWLRKTLFSLAFLFLAVPLPYIIYYRLTGPLQNLAARSALAGLRGMGVPALAQGNVIHLSNTSLEVAEACSGIRSLYAFLALGAILAYSLPIPAWGRWLLFLSTIPLSVAGNALRVWATGVGAYLVGPEVAHGVIHEFFGLITFVLVMLVFLLVRKGANSIWHSASSSPS